MNSQQEDTVRIIIAAAHSDSLAETCAGLSWPSGVLQACEGLAYVGAPYVSVTASDARCDDGVRYQCDGGVWVGGLGDRPRVNM